jgi:hypothetical protein
MHKTSCFVCNLGIESEGLIEMCLGQSYSLRSWFYYVGARKGQVTWQGDQMGLIFAYVLGSFMCLAEFWKVAKIRFSFFQR